MPVFQVPSTADRVVISGEFLNIAPELLFEYWVKPDLITQWWPPEAEIDPKLGGSYHLFWIKMNWHLRGHYTIYEPGRQLAFTWQWDHYPSVTEVIITFQPLPGGGTTLTLTHGYYSDSVEAQEARKGHLEGWQYFLVKLQELSTHE